jgi:hypothetical protein
MHDEIAVIHQNPFGVLITLDTDRFLPVLLQLLGDGVADRLDLALVRAGRDNEVVGERGYFPKVQYLDIGSFLGFRGADGYKPERGFNRGLGQFDSPVS